MNTLDIILMSIMIYIGIDMLASTIDKIFRKK